MKLSRSNSRTLGVRLALQEIEMIEQRAKEDGCPGIATYARQLILGSLRLPTVTTQILQLLLEIQRAIFEIAEKNAGEQKLTPERIRNLRTALDIAGESLLTAHVNKRRQKIGE